MGKIFPIVVKKVVSGGNLPAGASVLSDAVAPLKLVTADSIAGASDAFSASIRDTEADALSTQGEAVSVAPRGLGDMASTPAETRQVAVRCWAASASDNDSSRTSPANATGQNNGTVATVKTSLQTADTTNPVILSLTSFGVPSSGTWTQKLLRIYFQVAAAPNLDTVTLSYNTGGADTTLATIAAATNALSAGQTYDVSTLTLAQLQTLTLKGTYQAAVVLAPTTALTVDAAAVELVGTL